MIRALAMAAFSVAVFGLPDAYAETATGCLTQAGQIIRVALGSEPAHPCGTNQTEITLSLGEDDQGEEGTDTVSFFFEMADGEERTIITSGSTEIFARCQMDEYVLEPDEDVVSIIATSSEDGWFASGGLLIWKQEPKSRLQPHRAGEEATINLAINGGNYPDDTVFGRQQLEDRYRDVASIGLTPHGSVITPGGTFIRVDVDLALNMFGHDCIAVGTATVIPGGPE